MRPPIRPGALDRPGVGLARLAAVGLSVLVVLGSALPAPASSIRVTSSADRGPGSLREAIATANLHPGSTIEIFLDADAVIVVEEALPALKASGTRLLGGDATLREGEACRREDGRRGCSGLVVTAEGVVVRDLRIAGFTFDGVSVLGKAARDVRILDVQAVDNLDDGIGVSAGAGPVRIEGCLLMGNGFRTKGKGLLVFDDSRALLRDSLVVANRDGVTVTRGASARLEDVLVLGSYDKGVGVSAARLTGQRVNILSNGYDSVAPVTPPNADGLRVGLGGRASLSASLVAGNGDAGVVVLEESSVKLRNSLVEANRGGRQVRVSRTGVFRSE